jgi:hypothetical protein
MFGWIRDRIVERSIPPGVEDEEQERIAVEAAENAIRRSVAVVGIGGLTLFVGLAALLYGFLPIRQIVQGALTPSEVVSRGEADAVKLRQAKEESERKLNQVALERDRDTLQGQVTELERRLAEVATQKVGDLDRQVEDFTPTREATRVTAGADNVAPIPKSATKPRSDQVSAARRLAYRCGDGRTVRDPATCKATGAASPEVVPSVPDTYYCGDGRSVPSPADCRPAGAQSPQG